MKRSRGCRSDTQLVPEQPFVLQVKTGRWMCSFKWECLKTEVLGCGKRQEQYRLGRIPGCATGFLGTQLLRAAPGRLCFPLLLPGMSFGKHSAIEQRVSCRDWCSIAVAAQEEHHCSFPLGAPKGFQNTGEFLIRGFYILHLQRKVLNYRNIELLSTDYPNSQKCFFLLFLLYRTAE